MKIFRRTATACVLLFAFPFACFAQDRAILYPGDGATINGKATPITSAVVAGDQIQTGKAASQIVQAGTTVQVEAETSVQYGASLQLGCGGIVVEGTAPVEANGTRLTPAGRASYEVVNRGGNLVISVKSGTVSAGSDSVSAGQTITRVGTSGCQATVTPAVAGKGHGKLFGVLGAAAGAGVAGGVLAGRGGGPVSPSRP